MILEKLLVSFSASSHNESVKRIAEDSSIKKLCDGKKPGKNYEDPENCDGYIACTGVSVIHMKCPVGLWYDQTSNKCDLPSKVHCKRMYIYIYIYVIVRKLCIFTTYWRMRIPLVTICP